MIDIIEVTNQSQYQAIELLMHEYIAWDTEQTARLGLDPELFLNFYYGEEPDSLPSKFAPPGGCLLLANLNGHLAGCVGYRQLSEHVCELKQLYVRPECRGHGIGRALVMELLQRARLGGYQKVKLETGSFMTAAHLLYQSFGFEFCEPYFEIPATLRELTHFMELSLKEQ